MASEGAVHLRLRDHSLLSVLVQVRDEREGVPARHEDVRAVRAVDHDGLRITGRKVVERPVRGVLDHRVVDDVRLALRSIRGGRFGGCQDREPYEGEEQRDAREEGDQDRVRRRTRCGR